MWSSVTLYLGGEDDDPVVRWNAKRTHLVVDIGEWSLYVPPDTGLHLATDIVAAMPVPLEALDRLARSVALADDEERADPGARDAPESRVSEA